MRRRYGSQEQAKREIFARYASFIYLGNGRYGFAAASEYYFGKPLSSYTPEDAGKAALLAAISKSPRDYAPVPGDPRPLRRRNQILALMARNGYIPESLAKRCQDEPIRVAAHSPIKTDAPAAIEHVLDELNSARRESLRRRRPLPGADLGPLDGRRARADDRERSPRARSGPLREAAPQGEGVDPGLGGGARATRTRRSWPRRAGGRSTRDRDTRYSDYNRVTDSLRQPGSAMKPLVYLAAFETGLDLDTTVPDEPIEVPLGGDRRASSGSPTTTTSSRARSRCARPWPSRATRWPCGSRARSAWTTVIRTAQRDGDPHPAAALPRPRRSARRRCGCWSWRTPIAPSPRASWRSRTSSIA